jgi:hypothetical protein
MLVNATLKSIIFQHKSFQIYQKSQFFKQKITSWMVHPSSWSPRSQHVIQSIIELLYQGFNQAWHFGICLNKANLKPMGSSLGLPKSMIS